ncbi:PQQ-dependent sugar dehydrogenase, partial [Chryseobacterium sp. SIMBA_029]
MKISQFYIPAMSVFLILSSCQKNHANAQQIGNDGSVETERPNSEYEPAFKGQTRIKAVKTTTAYQVEVLNK